LPSAVVKKYQRCFFWEGWGNLTEIIVPFPRPPWNSVESDHPFAVMDATCKKRCVPGPREFTYKITELWNNSKGGSLCRPWGSRRVWYKVFWVRVPGVLGMLPEN